MTRKILRHVTMIVGHGILDRLRGTPRLIPPPPNLLSCAAMPLTPGSKLGPHEILSAIGAGGMGEIYRTKDTRLDLTVAVKILLGHVADRPEARAASGLNHPNLCTLFDVGTHDGLAYLVIEHLALGLS